MDKDSHPEMPFVWLIGKYLELASEQVEGTVVKTITYPLAVELVDKGFELSLKTMAEIKAFAAKDGIELSHVAVISMMVAKLKRVGPPIMSSETSLSILKDKNGKHSAILFDGCIIGGES